MNGPQEDNMAGDVGKPLDLPLAWIAEYFDLAASGQNAITNVVNGLYGIMVAWEHRHLGLASQSACQKLRTSMLAAVDPLLAETSSRLSEDHVSFNIAVATGAVGPFAMTDEELAANLPTDLLEAFHLHAAMLASELLTLAYREQIDAGGYAAHRYLALRVAADARFGGELH